MSNKLHALFIPINAVGHVNACLGLAEELIKVGHKVSFAIGQQWEGKLIKYGVCEIIYQDFSSSHADDNNKDPAKSQYEKMKQFLGLEQGKTPLDIMMQLKTSMNAKQIIGHMNRLDVKLGEIIKTTNPDVIFVDMPMIIPSIVKSGIPWLVVGSANPLRYLDDPRAPPAMSGLSATGDQNEWQLFRDTIKKTNPDAIQEFNKYLTELGVKNLKDTAYFFMDESDYLNIYSYPLEVDYLDLRPLPHNWISFDNFMRKEKQSAFDMPDKLKDKPGKLIYFSLGSMGAADVINMKRLVDILSKSKHRFIVSKGPLHTQFKLYDNMWGEASVPQIQVLPLVDLVITHGGNNTVAETFYHGKPMIVLPLWTDQFDNAQRVEDKGFGKRLDAYKCSEDELLITIESLLNDKILKQNLENISQRIQSDNSLAKLPKIIEDLVYNNKFKQ